MMKAHIEVNLFATLKKYAPVSADNYPIEAGTTVRSLLDELGIPMDGVKFIFINGTKGDHESNLQGGEIVKIFPLVRGGRL